MRAKFAQLALIVLVIPGAASAHRLDAYLQASILSVDRSQVRVFLRLVPGVAVAPGIIADIDSDKDGSISKGEERAYVARLLRDLSLRIDDQHLELDPVEWDFPSPEKMKEGLGEIQVTFVSEFHPGPGQRALVFENHHQPLVAAYMVNTLVPSDQAMEIVGQERNEDQSVLDLELVDTAQPSKMPGPLGGGIRRLAFSAFLALAASVALYVLLAQRHKNSGHRSNNQTLNSTEQNHGI